MKKYLLPKEGFFYKANLHCHSTVSDGKMTPEELKERYKAKGYSVLAYTDHNIMLSHQELTDEEFLALNGYEMDINEPTRPVVRTCHMCLIALEPDNLKQVCWHRNDYLWGNALNYRNTVQFYEEEPDYVREYTPECLNDMMKRGRDYGFFVTYNHPTWSCETYAQYIHYEYMHAMEIANYECQILGHEEYNSRVYDDMLDAGKRIYCIGTDDTHREKGMFGAWTMIKADRLEYRTITKALEEGNFYASQGPEIYGLWMEDGKVGIETSDAEEILFNFGTRRAKRLKATEGKSINLAVAEITANARYVRVTVVDSKGRKANTNAYFFDK